MVELYQSQGCSSCPPAIVNVNALAGRPNVLPLMFAVTYWDRLGWRDTFGDPAYTQRQWDYARHAGRPRVFTPQVVVNGGPVLVGDVKAQVERAVATARPLAAGPAIGVRRRPGDGGRGPDCAAADRVAGGAYDPRPRAVAIGAGENRGRTLTHRNVVRQLVPPGRVARRGAGAGRAGEDGHGLCHGRAAARGEWRALGGRPTALGTPSP